MIARWESECKYVCGVSGYATHAEERGKGKFCMCDRFSADGFRTRAVRMIRRRVLGFGRPKGKTGKERRGRPGGSLALGKRCVCSFALCVRRAGTRGPFHAPPQLKPRYEVKSWKKRREGSRTGRKGTVCRRGSKRNITGVTKRSNRSVTGCLTSV